LNQTSSPVSWMLRRGWHSFRHTFATDAARFSVNPFTLMSWLGHKAMTETLGYVGFAKSHTRVMPPEVLAAGAAATDPDRKVVAMLGARRHGKMTANRLGEGSA
jgi:integrase